jgi:protein-disulfide isomerase
MLKTALILTLLSASSLWADDKALVEFIKKSVRQGPNVVLNNVSIHSTKKPKELGGWEVVIVKLDFEIEKENQTKYEMVFRHGDMVAFDILDIKSKRSIKGNYSPPVDMRFYRSDRIIAGDKKGNGKHKILVFSDPLCPFCLDVVPDIITFAKAHPKDVSLYFYHFPIASIHPSSPTIIKAAVALELKGEKNVVERLYQNDFDYKVTDAAAVLKNFNKHFKSSLSLKDINDPKVLHHVKEDQELASHLMIRGTPSVFIDGEKDNANKLFEKLKSTYKK